MTMPSRALGVPRIDWAGDAFRAAGAPWWDVTHPEFQSLGALGSDDSNAILKATARAREAGGTVFFPGGREYHISTLLLIGSGVRWLMDHGAVLVQDVDTLPVIRINGAVGAELVNVNVRYKQLGARQVCGAIEVFGSQHWRVSGCRVLNSSGLGVQVGNSSDGRIYGNRVENTLADGIHVMNGGNAGMVSRRVAIVGNVTRDTDDDGIAVISYGDNGQLVCEHIAITGNVGSRSKARGITVGGGRFVTVTGNSVSETLGNAGINIIQDAVFTTHDVDYVTCVGNTVSPGLGAVDINSHGIRAWKLRRSVIAHNVVNWQQGTEIRVYGEVGQLVEDVIVQGNIVRGSAASGEKGIWLTRANNASVLDNIIVDAYKESLYVDSCDVVTVEGNLFREGNRSGLATRNLVTLAGNSNVRARRNRWKQTTSNFQHALSLATLSGVNDADYTNDFSGVDTTKMSGALLDQFNATTLSGYSADRGDNSVILTAADARRQRFLTALTVPRTVTLPTVGIAIGDRFEVIRLGLGAGTLDVGGIKTIPAGTAAWVCVTRTGGGWQLTGYGAL